MLKLVVILYKAALKNADKVIFQNPDNKQAFIDLGIVLEHKTVVVNGSSLDVSHFEIKPLPAAPESLLIALLLGDKGIRELLYKRVPKGLIERPKSGFAFPLADWLRRPLSQWASDLLDEKRLNEEGFFDSEKVNLMWSQYLSNKKNWEYQLWRILMFQSWYEINHK